MATFTMQLKEVIESIYGTTMDEDDYVQEYESITFGEVTYGELPTLPDVGVLLGIGGYPIFDENYRKVLNGKIIDRYWNREIGTETIDDFRLIIRRKMNEIMPYYNKLYKSELIDYTALDTMKIHSVNQSNMTGQESTEATTTSESNTESKARAVNSNFPQTNLAANADYATSATDSNSDSEVDATSIQEAESNNNTESNSDNLVTGYQGIASRLVTEFRNSLLNIDTMILTDIEDCFMLILNNGDEYFAREYGYGMWV